MLHSVARWGFGKLSLPFIPGLTTWAINCRSFGAREKSLIFQTNLLAEGYLESRFEILIKIWVTLGDLVESTVAGALVAFA